MAVKVVATPCLQWSQSSVPLSPKKRALSDVALAFRSVWHGTTSSRLCRSRLFEINSNQKKRASHFMRTACSARFDSFSDEEFSRKIQELAFQSPLSDDDVGDGEIAGTQWHEIEQEPFDWAVSIEMKANSADLPLSLRMIKRKKKQWQGGLLEAGESAYCSVKKAFSSMVFIIRELYSYTLHIRELLYYQDLKGILARVQSEMQASFVWLFQQVFSHTPTLMVYVMILLANFTVHSMSNSAAIAHAATPPATTASVEERGTTINCKFDSSAIKSFSVSSGGAKTTAVGGGNGGGSKAKPVANGTDEDGWAHRARREEEEVGILNSFVEEASRMQGEVRDEALDDDTLQGFVSPVTAKIVGDYDCEEYFRTELVYQTGLAQEPNNVLLLANYAQFLYLVAHDYDRAEEYFKRAVGIEPKDAEANNKYANFLWQVRKDLWAAEETLLEAISADPTNSFYAANYAHFLWNTGGEDTCFPLTSPDNDTLDSERERERGKLGK